MSSSNSIIDRFLAKGQEKGFSKKGLKLNLVYVGFLILALALVGYLAYSTFNADQYGNLLVKILFLLALVLAGVTGHLLQGPFAHFSVVLFLAVFNFFAAHYKHFTAASTSDILTEMKTSAEILFWSLAFFGFIYLAFVYFPVINELIPTADAAYREMKRTGPAKPDTMSAPKVAPAPVA
jgi:hypothetical protein